MAGSGEATPKKDQPLKKKAKRKEKTVKKSRSGSSRGKRCSKCKKKLDKFFRLLYCPVKPKNDSFTEYERYVADKYLHDECMRRIGKKGEIRKDERICNRCKVETKTKSLCIDYKGERTWQTFTFKVCLAEGAYSNALLPEKVTPGPADQRARMDWRRVRQKIEQSSPDSVEGVEARMMVLARQVHDSMTNERSPLTMSKEEPKHPAGKKRFDWEKVTTIGEKQKGGTLAGGKTGRKPGGRKKVAKGKKKVDKSTLMAPSVDVAGGKKRRAKMEPLVRPSTIKASEVKRRTGFFVGLGSHHICDNNLQWRLRTSPAQRLVNVLV